MVRKAENERQRISVQTAISDVLISRGGGEGAGSGGGGLAYDRSGDARRPAQACKFRILVSLRVF